MDGLSVSEEHSVLVVFVRRTLCHRVSVSILGVSVLSISVVILYILLYIVCESKQIKGYDF